MFEGKDGRRLQEESKGWKKQSLDSRWEGLGQENKVCAIGLRDAQNYAEGVEMFTQERYYSKLSLLWGQ